MGEHMVRVTHDAESHEYDCHDDCKVQIICTGVTDACRTWWECPVCQDARAALDGDDLDDFDEALHEAGEVHGIDHQWIDGMWMTPSEDCLGSNMLDNDAHDLVDELATGDHPVDLTCDDGFVYVRPIGQVSRG